MDKRQHQLRRSAMADFMESLEHLDELLGETTDSGVLEEDNLQITEAEKLQPSPRINPLTKQPSHQPGTHKAS